MIPRHRRLALLLALLTPFVLWAGDLVIPNVFTSGDPIRADQMNANFGAVKDVVRGSNSKSGTRLKAIGVTSADGLSSPISGGSSLLFWDSQLGTVCQAQFGAAVLQCTYAAAAVIYLDAACTQEAVLNNYSGLLLTHVVAQPALGVASFRPVGAPATVAQTYGVPACNSSNCTGCCAASGICVTGTADTVCGSNNLCANCAASANVCTNHACVGGGVAITQSTCVLAGGSASIFPISGPTEQMPAPIPLTLSAL